jgi:LemA protein
MEDSNKTTTNAVASKSKKIFSPLIIAGIILLILVIGAINSYNGLVKQNEIVDTQWAQVKSQYQRRFDLIPNFVESVKGVMKQETEIFTALANARQGYAGASTQEQKVSAASGYESAFARLLVITENYPQLRSVETVQTLMTQLEGTENRISVERMRYNDLVREYNIKVKSFPGNIYASVYGFTVKKTFDAAEGSEKAPQVKF